MTTRHYERVFCLQGEGASSCEEITVAAISTSHLENHTALASVLGSDWELKSTLP